MRASCGKSAGIMQDLAGTLRSALTASQRQNKRKAGHLHSTAPFQTGFRLSHAEAVGYPDPTPNTRYPSSVPRLSTSCHCATSSPLSANPAARQGRDGAFFGSVATLPMLAVFVLLRYKYIRKLQTTRKTGTSPEKSAKNKGRFRVPANRRKQKDGFPGIPRFFLLLAVQF